MSQAVLANKIGVTVNYISLLENGVRQPSLDCLSNLADALDVPVQLLAFFGGKSVRRDSPYKALISATEDAIRVAIAADQESEDE